MLSDLFNKSAFKFDEHTIFALQIMAILVIFRFQCNPILFFLCKLTPNTGNCYFCIFLIFLTEFSSVLFFEKPIHFFSLESSQESLLGSHCTLCSSSAWALGSQTPKEPSLHHAHIHVMCLSVTQRLSVGGPSPPSPLPSKTACSFDETSSLHEHLDDFVLLFQKRLTIQGKTVDMHYSHPRNKYEDWLCSTVS